MNIKKILLLLFVFTIFGLNNTVVGMEYKDIKKTTINKPSKIELNIVKMPCSREINSREINKPNKINEGSCSSKVRRMQLTAIKSKNEESSEDYKEGLEIEFVKHIFNNKINIDDIDALNNTVKEANKVIKESNNLIKEADKVIRNYKKQRIINGRYIDYDEIE